MPVRHWIIPLFMLTVLGGCATSHNSPDVYRAGETQREVTIRLATVDGVRPVKIQRSNNQVGTLAGAAVGGIAGSGVGQGRGSAVGAVLGAVGGAVIGQAMEGSANLKEALEITVRLDTGELRAIVQEADVQFKKGDRVRLIGSGNTVRVAPNH